MMIHLQHTLLTIIISNVILFIRSSQPTLKPTTNFPLTVQSKTTTRVPSRKPTSLPSRSPTAKTTTRVPSSKPTSLSSRSPTTKTTTRAPSSKPTSLPSRSPTTKTTTLTPSSKETSHPSRSPTTTKTTTTASGSIFYLGSYNPTNIISRWSYNANQSVTYLGASKLERRLGMSPSWISFSSDRRFLFATNEYQNFVSSYAVDKVSGSLTIINTVSSGGNGSRSPCHMSVDPLNRYLLVVNYFGGIVAQIPISSTGVLSPPSVVIKHFPAVTSNIHGIYIYNNFATVMDKGQDVIKQYPITTTGISSTVPSVAITVPKGTGPNHLAYHPTLPIAITLNANGNSLTVLPLNRQTGALGPLKDFSGNTISTLIPGSNSTGMLAAEIVISPNGNFVYASNRDISKPSKGRSSIVVFSLSPTTLKLSLLQFVSSKGDYARHFQLANNGNNLVLANQISNNFVSYKVNPTTGLIDTNSVVTTISPYINQPSCILFY